MFTPDEQPLLDGDEIDLQEFIENDRCLVADCDWRGTEEESVDHLADLLPPGTLTHETTENPDGTFSTHVRFKDREDTISLPARPLNNFRVLLRVWQLLRPDYDIRLLRCSEDSDTQAFVLRPESWWNDFRTAFPQRYEEIFRDMSELDELLGL